MDKKREQRIIGGELRVLRRDNDPPQIVGISAVFDTLSDDLGGFREKIDRGAFKDAIGGDVAALFNHDANLVLGRTTAGTLALKETREGLEMTVTPPDTQMARDLMTSIERGDIVGQSFSFETEVDEWQDVQDGPDIRTLKKIRTVFDVGPVTFPAYPDTDVAVREHRSWEEGRNAADKKVAIDLDKQRKILDLADRKYLTRTTRLPNLEIT